MELGNVPSPVIEIPLTSAPVADLRPYLKPRSNGARRVIVLIRSKSEPFPEDRDGARLMNLAEAEGWTEDQVIELPDGGTVRFLVHRSR
jgi:hypothetical protein